MTATATGKQSQLVEQYFKVHVGTAPKDQLLLMVVDGAVRFAERGREAIEKNDLEEKNNALQRAQGIVMGLANALSPEIGDQIYMDLRGLYFFVYRRLIEANLEHSLEKIDEALKILLELRETWRNAVEQYRNSIAAELAAESTASDAGTEREGISVSG